MRDFLLLTFLEKKKTLPPPPRKTKTKNKRPSTLEYIKLSCSGGNGRFQGVEVPAMDCWSAACSSKAFVWNIQKVTFPLWGKKKSEVKWKFLSCVKIALNLMVHPASSSEVFPDPGWASRAAWDQTAFLWRSWSSNCCRSKGNKDVKFTVHLGTAHLGPAPGS